LKAESPSQVILEWLDLVEKQRQINSKLFSTDPDNPL
jgi:hypothetical protein